MSVCIISCWFDVSDSINRFTRLMESMPPFVQNTPVYTQRKLVREYYYKPENFACDTEYNCTQVTKVIKDIFDERDSEQRK